MKRSDPGNHDAIRTEKTRPQNRVRIGADERIGTAVLLVMSQPVLAATNYELLIVIFIVIGCVEVL